MFLLCLYHILTLQPITGIYAKAVEAAGAAKVILDKELTGEKLLEEIEKLLINDNQLQAMKKAAKSLGRPEAAAEIAQQALNLVRK